MVSKSAVKKKSVAKPAVKGEPKAEAGRWVVFEPFQLVSFSSAAEAEAHAAMLVTTRPEGQGAPLIAKVVG